MNNDVTCQTHMNELLLCELNGVIANQSSLIHSHFLVHWSMFVNNNKKDAKFNCKNKENTNKKKL